MIIINFYNKLSSYFLTAKDALYILSNRIENRRKKLLNV